MPAGPWWNNLETTFSQRPEGFELELLDKTRVTLTAALDVALRTGGALGVGALALPLGFHPLKLRQALADRDLYQTIAESGDPRIFFRQPQEHVVVQTRAPGWPHYEPDDGICQDLRFASAFEPLNPRHRKEFRRHAQNRIARARYWCHRDGPRPTIMAVHGFFADPYWLNEWFFQLPWLYRMGADVLLFTLPFHGERQTRFSPFSGHGFFAGGVTRINEAFAQAVHDFRVFVDYLCEQRGVQQVGVTGVSLGGLTAALLAAVEPRLSFAIPNVPVTTIADLVLEWQPLGTALRALLALTGYSIRDLRHVLAVSCPLTYPPLLSRDRLMIIGGVGDRLAPPKHSRLLWDHWKRCRIHWFPGSHVIHLDRGEYLKQIARFLGEIGFFEEKWQTPWKRHLRA
ncbi:MAG: alpha/beta hydrolase [Candidatus Schekmanbacteria bacterium]|nr:alpha/beta hydrolase [Candidatus Schekmanbacteria bacterium]